MDLLLQIDTQTKYKTTHMHAAIGKKAAAFIDLYKLS